LKVSNAATGAGNGITVTAAGSGAAINATTSGASGYSGIFTGNLLLSNSGVPFQLQLKAILRE